ncbi:MAG: hypothetical protein ABUK01_01600 [Leptospirales bacterium]
MTFKEKFVKYGSYTFVLFLTSLIIIAFGMPDCTGALKKRGNKYAADIDGDPITWTQVNRTANNLGGTMYPDGNMPPEARTYMESMAIERLVNLKLFIILSKEAGFYPTMATQNIFENRYLVENFPQYITENGFDLVKFRDEIQEPNRYSNKIVIDDAIQQYALRRNELMFQGIYKPHQKETEDLYLLNNTKISYHILVINMEAKNKLVEKRANITEKDIREKFNKDFLANNPQDKLTKIKREGITQSLVNERRAVIEKELLEEMLKMAETLSMKQLQNKYGGSLKALPNLNLNTNIAQQWPASPANLSLLTEDKMFLQNTFKTELGQIVGPINKGEALFIYSITKRDIPDLNADDLDLSQQKLQPSVNHFEAMYGEMMGILRRQYTVNRYNAPTK